MSKEQTEAGQCAVFTIAYAIAVILNVIWHDWSYAIMALSGAVLSLKVYVLLSRPVPVGGNPNEH